MLAAGALAAGAAFAAAPTVGGTNTPFLKLGRIEIRPHLVYALEYQEGVLSRPGDADSTFVESVAPGVAVQFGANWNIDYTADAKFYSGRDFEDTVNHAFTITGLQPIGKMAVSGTQSVSSSANPSFETGRQTRIIAVLSSLSAGMPVGNKLSLVGSISQSLQFVETAPDSGTWSGNAGASFDSGRGWVVNTGVTSGYSAVYKSPDTFFVGPQVSLLWQATGKLAFSLTGSLEDRETLGGTRQRQFTPSYNATATFTPFSQTSIALTGVRANSPSLLGGQELESSQFGVTLQQRLLGRLRTNLGFSYGLSNYTTTVTAGPRDRRDDLYTYTTGFTLPVARRGGVSVRYQRSINNSNAPGFDTDSTTVGFDVSYRY